MAISLTTKKSIRKSFGRVPEVAPMPNLIEVQKSSYDHFLQMGIVPEQRAGVGLQEVFKSVFPIRDFSERAQLEFVRYELETPISGTGRAAQAGSMRRACRSYWTRVRPSPHHGPPGRLYCVWNVPHQLVLDFV